MESIIANLRILAADAALREKFASRLVLVTKSSEPGPKPKLLSKIGRNLMQIFGGI